MNCILSLLLFTGFSLNGNATTDTVVPGFERRIRNFVDSVSVVDTHEHLFSPEIVNGSYFSDLMLLFQQNGYDDLISAVMPRGLFDTLYNEPVPPAEKWKIIEPYYNHAFNTSYFRVILFGINRLYGIKDLNQQTVIPLSAKIKETYSSEKFDRILKDSCKIEYVIQDGYLMPGREDYFRYARRFDHWLDVRSKFTIDSLAMVQVDSIVDLDDFESSLAKAFEKGVKEGMAVVKVSLAYSRTLQFEKTDRKTAQKIFRKLVKRRESYTISRDEAKPLQDYLMYRLLELADKYDIPVAIHTGLQAGKGNFLSNSNPLLLNNLFIDFPGVKFSIYHGSYPFGGELSALAKSFKNVYIDMNWMYSISPSYSERYLNEWIEAVPANKLMAFGGDCMAVENVYSELHSARAIISKVLTEKVRDGYFSENEAITIARMILHDNAIYFYKLHR